MPLGVGKSVCKIEHANKQTNKQTKKTEKYVCKQNPYFSYFTLLFAKQNATKMYQEVIFVKTPFV